MTNFLNEYPAIISHHRTATMDNKVSHFTMKGFIKIQDTTTTTEMDLVINHPSTMAFRLITNITNHNSIHTHPICMVAHILNLHIYDLAQVEENIRSMMKEVIPKRMKNKPCAIVVKFLSQHIFATTNIKSLVEVLPRIGYDISAN